MLPSNTANTAGGSRNNGDSFGNDPSESMIVAVSPRLRTASRKQMLQRSQKGGPPEQEMKSTETENYSNSSLEDEVYSTSSKLAVLDDTGDNTGATLKTSRLSDNSSSFRSLDSTTEYLERKRASRLKAKGEPGLRGHEQDRRVLPDRHSSDGVPPSRTSSRFRRSKTLPDLKHMMRQIILPPKKSSAETISKTSDTAGTDQGHQSEVMRRESDSALSISTNKKLGAATGSAAFSPGLLKKIRQKARLKRHSTNVNSSLLASSASWDRADLSDLEVPINTSLLSSQRGIQKPLKSFSSPETSRKTKRREELVQSLSPNTTNRSRKLSSKLPSMSERPDNFLNGPSSSSISTKHDGAPPVTHRVAVEAEGYRWEAHFDNSSTFTPSESCRDSVPATTSLTKTSKKHETTSSLNEARLSTKVPPKSRKSKLKSPEEHRSPKGASVDASFKSQQPKQKSPPRQKKAEITQQFGQGLKEDISERSLSMEEIIVEEPSNIEHGLANEQKMKRKKNSEKKFKNSPKAKDDVVELRKQTNQLPPLTDFHSADIAAKTSLNDAELSSPESEQSDNTPSPEIHLGLKRKTSPPLSKSSSFPDLEAVVAARVTDDAPSLRSDGIFFDSPENSPLSDLSLPSWRLSQPNDSVVERLSSSMPNLDAAHFSSSDEDDIHALSKGTSEKNKNFAAPATADVFAFGETDNSEDLKTVLAETEQKNAEAEHAAHCERDYNTIQQAETQIRSSSDFHAARAGLLEQFKSHARAQAARHGTVSSSGATAALDRGLPARNPPQPAARPSAKAKLDRGPRKPRRRSESFEETLPKVDDQTQVPVQSLQEFQKGSSRFGVPPQEDSLKIPVTSMVHDGPRQPQRRSDFSEEIESAMNDQSSMPVHSQQSFGGAVSHKVGASEEESFKIPATSMAFRRTRDRRWIQTTPDKVVVKRPFGDSSIEIGEMHSSSSPLERQRYHTTSVPGLRRTSSTGSLVEGGAEVASAGRRWDSGEAAKSDGPPKFSRPSSSQGQDLAASVSMDRMELEKLLTLPRAKAKKNNSLERSYLPVRLQGATKRSDRKANSQSIAKRQGDEFETVAKSQAEDSSGPCGGLAEQKSIAVDTGLHDVFAITGEIEGDLAKFENRRRFS